MIHMLPNSLFVFIFFVEKKRGDFRTFLTIEKKMKKRNRFLRAFERHNRYFSTSHPVKRKRKKKKEKKKNVGISSVVVVGYGGWLW